MTDARKLSRRDWFRLRLPPQTESNAGSDATNHDVQRSSMGQKTPGLKPIAEPVNHDGLDLSQLPPMREAMLSVDEVNQLFADIEMLGTDILLMQRSHRAAQATASRANTLEQMMAAKNALLTSAISRIQIRYRWQAAAWIDTLERRPDGFRLVRISHG